MSASDLASSSGDFSWGLGSLKQRPLRYVGITLHIILRYMFGAFWLMAAINKFVGNWLFTDYLKQVFLQRLTELNPESFPALYLTKFALPIYPVIAWIVVWGELVVAIGLLLGLAVRASAFLSFFILFNLAIGGYYDASLIPFFLLSFLFMAYPSGRWLGIDRRLHRKNPSSPWY